MMSKIDEYALWLIFSGAEDSIQEDLNEGEPPLSEEEWHAARKRATEIVRILSANTRSLLAFVAIREDYNADAIHRRDS